MNRRLLPYCLHTRLDFGKWEGATIQTVIEKDPDYLDWCCDNVDGFELDDEAAYELETRSLLQD